VDASLDDLKSELVSGPVIVNTGVKISAANGVRSLAGEGNTNHSIVVTGISADGSQVTVNDPWSGKQLNYSTEEFNKIWTRGQNIMTSIRPAV
jgi:predicted double-glycine peptidase